MGIYIRGGQYWGLHKGKRFPLEVPTGPMKSKQKDAALVKYGERVLDVSMGVNFIEQKQAARHTLGDMLGRWWNDHASKQKSAKTRQYQKARLLRDLKADTKLTDITSDVIERYKTKRANEGIGPAAINRELAMLRAAFTFAIRKWKWYSRTNPVWEAGLLDGEKEIIRCLTEDEADRLKAVSPAWFWEICEFVIDTGLRREELCKLELADVNMKQQELTVRDGKNGEAAETVPLMDTAYAILQRRTPSVATKALFYDERHRHYKPDRLSRWMQRLTKEAGIESFRFHDLRHTAATRLAQQGVDVYTIQRVMRHSDIKMTDRYIHLDTTGVKARIKSTTQKTAQSRQASVMPKAANAGLD